MVKKVENLANNLKALVGMVRDEPTGGDGFKSICNKSLWFENPKYREVLMELAMMCQETNITTFVSNIDDL